MVENERLMHFYLGIKALISSSSHRHELAWHEYVHHHAHSEKEILLEGLWAIVSTGMSDRVVRVLHPRLVSALDAVPSAEHLLSHRSRLRRSALRRFQNARKIDAFFVFAARLATQGPAAFLAELHRDPHEALRGLPFFGPASSLHLAKNLGVPVAKPDRHLVRLCDFTGQDAQTLCTRIAAMSNDTVHVVDYVFWRYLSLEANHINTARQFLRPHDATAN